MNDELFHRLETHARQREARGASKDEMQLYANLLTLMRPPRPKLRPASRETLAIIQQQPGIHPTAIAALRDVPQNSAHKTVRFLERNRFIRTEMQGNHRACYAVEGA